MSNSAREDRPQHNQGLYSHIRGVCGVRQRSILGGGKWSEGREVKRRADSILHGAWEQTWQRDFKY